MSGDPADLIKVATTALLGASEYAERVTGALRRAQQAIVGLAVR
jgi:hypothetical protein